MANFNTRSVQAVYILLDNYKTIIENKMNYLNANFNFGLSADNDLYDDFWRIMIKTESFYDGVFDPFFIKIAENSQYCCDILNDKYMNLIGLAAALDKFICFAGDSFERTVDGAWSFGTGSIYKHIVDGAGNVIKYGMDEAVNDVSEVLNNIQDKINLMDIHKFNDINYLTDIRDNYFVPEITKIRNYLTDAMVEVGKILEFSEIIKKSLDETFPNAFKMYSCISLAFSLNTKMSRISNQVLYTGSPSSQINRIGLTVAKIWKKQVKPDYSNREQCFTQAVLQGLDMLPVIGDMEYLIDKSWELGIQKFSGGSAI